MGNKKEKSLLSATAELRRQADEQLQAKAPDAGFSRTDDETQRLLHELQVHQIELEMQNTELRQARDELETLLDKYTDLFDFAPVGYFTLDSDGSIRSVNLSGAGLLGVERSSLIGRHFEHFVPVENRSHFTAFLGKVFASSAKEEYEAALLREGHSQFFVQIEAVSTAAGQECRIALIDITERKKMEALMEESEERFRSIAENMPNMVMTHVDGKFVYLNPTAVSSLGIENQQELIGMSFIEIVHPNFRNLAREHVSNITDNKQLNFKTEKQLLRKDGSSFWVEITGISTTYEGDKAVHVIAVDITERKLAEIDRSRLLLRQRAILDNLPMLAWLKDADGRLEMVNEPFAKACGHSVEECIGATDLDVWPLEMAKSYMADDREVCITGEKKQVEEPIFTPNGTKWHLTHKTPLFDEQGRVVGTTGIAQDITERKKAEEALRASESRYRSLIDNIPLGINLIDRDHRIVMVNNTTAKLFGQLPEWFVGHNCFEAFEKRENTCPYCPGIISMRSGKPSMVDTEGIRDDGSRIFAHIRTMPIISADGETTGFIEVVEDITEHKQVEEEKDKLEAQLQQAQKMESVGRLAGGVAHDFNNMLGVILGHADLALMGMEPSHPLFHKLEEIRKAAERSANLTRQLLAFARKQNVTPKVLALNEIVAGMLKMLNRLIGENIHLSWHPAANLWPVKIDPSQIDQILANLCVNARDAIVDVGMITIETGNSNIDEDYCAAHAEFVPGEYVKLVVSDNGCGMDKIMLDHIFEPFYTTKGVGVGTGLGLATVYGIVKQNKGYIYVYSEYGTGTTFTIYLPRYEGNGGHARHEDSARPVLFGQETILLVEDEPAILKLTTEMLEKQGYTVLAASTPGEAIRLAREHAGEICLLMTDVIMPEMNGRDLAKNLLPLYPNLKRLFMSGYTADIIAHHGVLDEGVHFIQKPFTMHDLASKVREVMDSK